ncbi:MAG: FtsX-like permease family protein, partial [Lachnospiraceae bacterium]|nr:FtsX-like permease family protein [Lachnospiraceae bacterium]
MLAKLALRNIKRSIQDYVLYVITITFILALMFAFNSMMFSDLILGMNAHMTDYRMLLVLFSVIVLIVVSWLINYMTRFMLERRSREFGTYLILGMENKTVSKLFFYENVIFGVISLILGCFLGSFIFQGLLFVISSFFGEEYKVEADFSLAALFLTILYYLLIQFLVVFRNNQYLKKLKIKDLMNADKVNEQVKVKHVKRNVILFLVSIVALLVACSKAPVIVVIICMIVFIYCFYIGISGIMVLLIEKSKRFKYKKLNVFVFRQLSSKINTMGFTMGTIAVLFTLALLSSNYAIGLSNFKGEIEKHAPFDICVTDLDAGENFSEVREMLKEDGWIKKDLVYSIYRSEDAKFTNVLKDNQVLGGYFQYDTYMRVSDYNVLRGFLGLEEV